MTHSYTICEQSYDLQRDDTGQFMPGDHSGFKMEYGAGSSRVTNNSRHDQLEEELDPCLSAAVRYKKESSDGLTRLKCCLCCVVVLLALALLAVALLMMFGNDDFMHMPHRTTQYAHSEKVLSNQQNNQPMKSDNLLHEHSFIKRPFRGQDNKTITTIKKLAIISSKNTSKRPTVVMAQPTTLSTTKPKKEVSETVRDCDFFRKAGKKDGVYRLVLPAFGEFDASCLMEADYGWVVLQRRSNDRLSFWNNTYGEYAVGFGELNTGGDGWLGLNWIHALSELSNKLEMRIRLEGDLCKIKSKRSCSGFGDNGSWWGDWEFSLGSRSEGFRISNLHFLRGNLSFNESGLDLFSDLCNGFKFTTVDLDNDMNQMGNCAIFRERGAWWHGDCAHTVLNGRYGMTSPNTHGMFWNRPSPPQQSDSLLVAHDAYIIKPKKSLILVRIPDH